jgi:allantoate deiminase
VSAGRILARCDELARFTEEEGMITRWYGSPSLLAAADAVAGWMEEAGLAVRRDAVGSVIGRVGEGPGTFVLGSHVDTVRDAGRYDGPLGVLLGIEAADGVGGELPFALEVVAFADEEGGRFPLTYLGSRGWTGDLEPGDAARANGLGEVLGDAARAMGGDPGAFGTRSAPDDILGYLEVHIEQGPVLQDEDLPVGIVTAIAAQSRGTADFRGMAGHAGNTPMHLRRDALAGAAEFVLEVERTARATDGLTATVGWIGNEPNVGNVIAGHTWVTYDVRHQDDATRDRARDELEAAACGIAERRRLELDWRRRDDLASVPMSTRLRVVLAQACEQAGVRPRELGSGAGHDAVTASRLTSEVAMLFVRCKDGISHHPDESVRPEDVGVALDVVVRFLHLLTDPVSVTARKGD